MHGGDGGGINSPQLPMNFRREHSGNYTTQVGGRPNDGTPMTRMGPQPYEFDSCISTEEAFFGIEELKNSGYRQNEHNTNGSNPQEDSTPKSLAQKFAIQNRRTAESFTRGAQASQTINTPGFSAAMRQRTQRLSPKLKSMGREHANAGQSSGSPKNRNNRNQSVKLLGGYKDDSQGSQKLKSEFIQPKPQHRLPSSKNKVYRQSSNLNSQKLQDVTPLDHKKHSSNGSGGILMDDYSSDLGVSKSTPQNRSASRQSINSPLIDEKGKIKMVPGRLNNGNRQTSKEPQQLQQALVQEPGFAHTESQRVIQPIVHAGQGSMKEDMRFGWRPEFNEKDRINRKEAVAIKLTYPTNKGLFRTSIRGSQLFNELYRHNKNFRQLKSQNKKIYDPEFNSKLVYQGYRPTVSIELHLRYGQKASFNEEQQFYDVLIPNTIKQKAIESGLLRKIPRSVVDDTSLLNNTDPNNLNSSAGPPKCELAFDSMFESGNLDLAIQVQPREFNLYLKPDTNTKGYCNWFFFKIQRKPDSSGRFPRRTYQFNIMNMYKKKILYRQEATPLACFKEIHFKNFIMQELENVEWKSNQFSNIGYGLVTNQANTTQAAFQKNQTEDENNNLNTDNSQTKAIKDQALVFGDSNQNSTRKQKFFCLAFDFEFPSGQELAYIASSIPYPYTFLQKTIKTCARLDQSMTTLTRSLGGLQIPLLTITNEAINISNKRTVIICGRIHPGETNSSWVLHGMIDYLISKDASHLRDCLIFKIIPMINPDGVVAGNYRTSFIGKDLNRLYLEKEDEEVKYNVMDEILKPEITAMKQLIKGCKQDDSKGVLAFIDVHHHSQKRGAFMYGPYYQMQNSKYQEVRVLPKLISMMVPEIFRFQSCRFKNQSYKENCARLYCDREQGITYSFCLECSQQGYFTTSDEFDLKSKSMKKGRHVRYFDQNSLMYLGRKICEASFMLNQMSDVQDKKRNAITKRRKQRLGGKKSGVANKKGQNGKQQQAQTFGRLAGAKNAKGGAGDQNSINDFDLDSEDHNRSSNISMTSQEFIQSGFNPKIGIKGFIAQMMKKLPESSGDDLKSEKSNNSRGALRSKNIPRPLTHFGSEDAVSEKSEKEEESLSEDGSADSDAQDLSEDDQDRVLNQVLDELMPNRVKKINPLSAQVTITNQKPEQLLATKPHRKMPKSALRVITVDKKLVQKEQLLMPKAVPDLQVNNGSINFLMTKPTTGLMPSFDDPKQFFVLPPSQQKTKEEVAGENSFFAITRKNKKKSQAISMVQGCYLPNSNQGYISQRQQLNKKRILSGKQKSQSMNKPDMFANKGYIPPGATRQQQTSTQNNTKLQYNNIYSMVQSSAAQSTFYAQQQETDNTTQASIKQQQNQSQAQQQQPLRQSTQSSVPQTIINRSSLRTAGNLQHSYSHTKDDMTMGGSLKPPAGPIIRQSFTNQHKTRGGVGQKNNSNLMFDQNESQQFSQAGTQNRIPINQMFDGGQAPQRNISQDLLGGVEQNFNSTFYQPGLPLDQQWLFAQQAQQQSNNNQQLDNNFVKTQNFVANSPERIPIVVGSSDLMLTNHQNEINQQQTLLNQRFSQTQGKRASIVLSSKDLKKASRVSKNRITPDSKAYPDKDRTNLPLNQGGFFHRKQIVVQPQLQQQQNDDSLLLNRQIHSSGLPQQTNYPDVVQNRLQQLKLSKPGMSQSHLQAKRKSAVITAQVKNLSSQASNAGPINKISHKRQSQNHQTALNSALAGGNGPDNNASFESYALTQTQKQSIQFRNSAIPTRIQTQQAVHHLGSPHDPRQQFLINQDLNDRVLSSNNNNIYNSPPTKKQNHMRLMSSRQNNGSQKQYAQTVAKKTDALIIGDGTNGGAGNLSGQGNGSRKLIGISRIQQQQQQHIQSQQQQKPPMAAYIIDSNRQSTRSHVLTSHSNKQQSQRVATANKRISIGNSNDIRISAAQQQIPIGNNSNNNTLYNRIGHNQSQQNIRW